MYISVDTGQLTMETTKFNNWTLRAAAVNLQYLQLFACDKKVVQHHWKVQQRTTRHVLMLFIVNVHVAQCLDLAKPKSIAPRPGCLKPN